MRKVKRHRKRVAKRVKFLRFFQKANMHLNDAGKKPITKEQAAMIYRSFGSKAAE